MGRVSNVSADSQWKSDRAESGEVLSAWVRDARNRTLQMVADLDDQQIMGPMLPTVNPLLWEMGHAAWFQEHWVLRHVAGQQPILAGSDDLFDSIAIEHAVRWDLPIPPRQRVIGYLEQVADNVIDLLNRSNLTEELVYFVKLSVFHEDMHAESFAYTRQTHGYPMPQLILSDTESCSDGDHDPGEVEFDGCEFMLGAARDTVFAFDNEKWANPVHVQPFSISRQAVNQQQFAEFVNDGGYRRREFWCDDGWQWRTEHQATHPVYWNYQGDIWMRRHFDCWVPLEPDAAMMHVNWYEANAWCRWAGRRLPTEAEWELAAAGSPHQRHYPWGEQAPEFDHANLDFQVMGCVPTWAHPQGDSPEGCRQLIGNVWEWTANTFQPYPGFAVDPYKDYSKPSFGKRKVLRGGCWATTGRMIRNTWRNYYQADRRDVFGGFRTCAQ